MSSKSILIPLPHYGFDPTEAAIPWRKLTEAGYRVTFATPDGAPARADERMVSGKDLPLLLKKTLMAEPEAVAAYEKMRSSEAFMQPVAYSEIQPDRFDAIMLPGGHDKGMRPYLESKILQDAVAWFFDHDRPVAAICHGTLLAGRTVSNEDPERKGKSVLFGRKTTGLTRNQEMIAYFLTKLKLGDYYRTYDQPMADELKTYLRLSSDYLPGPGMPVPTQRDSDHDLSAGFVVQDGQYLSARWPGDAHRFGEAFVALLKRQGD